LPGERARVGEDGQVSHALDEFTGLVASHYELAGLAEQAARYYRRAAGMARQTHAHQHAIAFLQRALALLDGSAAGECPPGEENGERCQLLEDLGDLLELTGEHDQARTAYREALACTPSDRVTWICGLGRKAGDTFKSQGRYRDALQAYREAEEALNLDAPSCHPPAWQEWVEIQCSRIDLYYGEGDAGKMDELAERVETVVERYGTRVQRARFFALRSKIGFRRDRYVVSDQTLLDCQRALAASREVDEPGRAALAQFGLGFAHLLRNEPDQAEENIKAALEVATRIGNAELQVLCITYLALLFRREGEMELAQHYAERSLAAATANGMPTYAGMARANLAWLAWRAGGLGEVQGNGQAALELWRDSVYPFQWAALWPLISLALSQGHPADAIRYSRMLLEPTQQRLSAGLHAILADGIRAWEDGDGAAAHEHLVHAKELAQETGYL
jgi:tetratricopeptide (TPR) repeat protein